MTLRPIHSRPPTGLPPPQRCGLDTRHPQNRRNASCSRARERRCHRTRPRGRLDSRASPKPYAQQAARSAHPSLRVGLRRARGACQLHGQRRHHRGDRRPGRRHTGLSTLGPPAIHRCAWRRRACRSALLKSMGHQYERTSSGELTASSPTAAPNGSRANMRRSRRTTLLAHPSALRSEAPRLAKGLGRAACRSRPRGGRCHRGPSRVGLAQPPRLQVLCSEARGDFHAASTPSVPLSPAGCSHFDYIP